MIAGSALLSLLVTLVIVGLIAWVLWWFVGYVGLPEPFAKVANVIIALVVVVFLIDTLLSLSGSHLFR